MIVGGESIVRNLLYGIKNSREFGPHMEIGYLPVLDCSATGAHLLLLKGHADASPTEHYGSHYAVASPLSRTLIFLKSS